jgi:hypothetical protein
MAIQPTVLATFELVCDGVSSSVTINLKDNPVLIDLGQSVPSRFPTFVQGFDWRTVVGVVPSTAGITASISGVNLTIDLGVVQPAGFHLPVQVFLLF